MPQKGITGLSLEARMQHAADQKASKLSVKEYALQHGFTDSAVYSWIAQYNQKLGIPSSRQSKKKVVPEVQEKPKQEIIDSEVVALRAQVAALTIQRDELMGKLDDANTTIKSLTNVVVYIGHNLGGE